MISSCNKFLSVIILLAAGFIASPAGANDSSAAIGLGGLELRQSDEISLDQEELRISRLIIEGEEPLTMASLCMTGARRISPTQVEFRKQNFKPDRDLDVLLVY